SAGRRRSTSRRGWSGRCAGTATTRSGGSRSAPASTASTTRNSTAGRWADRPPLRSLREAAPGDRRAGDEDRQIDEEVGDRVPPGVELAVEAPHRAVEGEVVPQAPVALLLGRPALDLE